jgi:hypothetical protein
MVGVGSVVRVIGRGLRSGSGFRTAVALVVC